MASAATILVVDDDADAREILIARLNGEGYRVTTAPSGTEALAIVEREPVDLVLLDLVMPGLDGLATLAGIKKDKGRFLPTILVTARGDAEDVVRGLKLGADEYIVKPFDHSALVARVQAMLRLKALHDQLAELNDSLERRVVEQVDEIQRMSRLKRFLAPQVAEAILAWPDAESVLKSHRREVTVLFCDLRGFTSFAEKSTPADLMAMLHDYHEVVGELVFAHEGTLERFAGDSVMVLFNDPVEAPDHRKKAVALAFDIIKSADPLFRKWRRQPSDLGLGIGIASGLATIGRIGFRERLDYAAIGMVTNLASRLSAQAEASQILTDAPVGTDCEPIATSRSLGDREIRGLAGPVAVFQLLPKSA